ncbi:hypothetical protein NBRC116494_13590 [Aurantivibrio plasticivorans]
MKISKSPRVNLSVILPVYNGMPVVKNTIDNLLSQRTSDVFSYELIVVDDGSTDNLLNYLEERKSFRIKIVELDRNSGRALACNAGIRAANGEVVGFIDADCAFVNDDALLKHYESVRNNKEGSYGGLRAESRNKFWKTYQENVFSKWKEELGKGSIEAISSTNLFVPVEWFKLEVFSPLYKGYGFEDRDLLIRMKSHGKKISFCDGALVIHYSPTYIAELVQKMYEMGCFSGEVFSQLHYSEYVSSNYAKVDPRVNKGLLVKILYALYPFLAGKTNFIDMLLSNKSCFPYVLKNAVVKLVLASAYAAGVNRRL